MQSINHKGLYVKCGTMGHLGTIDYGHIYLGNLNSKRQFYMLEILFKLVVQIIRHKGVVDLS